MDKKTIGRRIKDRRLALNMTQSDIANAVGVAISTVQRYEAGTIERIKLPVIESIARVIGVNADWLIGKTEDETCSYSLLPDNILPMPEMKKIPLIGSIACGTPILAEENIEQYSNWKSEAATLDIQGYPAFSPTLLWRLVPSKSRSPFRHKGKN